jgi:hypothetical protein
MLTLPLSPTITRYQATNRPHDLDEAMYRYEQPTHIAMTSWSTPTRRSRRQGLLRRPVQATIVLRPNCKEVLSGRSAWTAHTHGERERARETRVGCIDGGGPLALGMQIRSLPEVDYGLLLGDGHHDAATAPPKVARGTRTSPVAPVFDLQGPVTAGALPLVPWADKRILDSSAGRPAGPRGALISEPNETPACESVIAQQHAHNGET